MDPGAPTPVAIDDARRRVQRSSGLLVPGFSKRLSRGLTYFLGVPIGRYDVQRPGGAGAAAIELCYLRWPVVDVLVPRADGAFDGTGLVRFPGGRRRTFCTFVLEGPGD